eukprot:comp18984_c0_seq1/m.21311 comp18984_c0_seq1/g.21311  ORF comp18984_c0_seq1/g.21311 comp18984_c0_seq1/m.21311 type:complete len:292 (-) comp18984_c0_seq1:175-1050(-)
MRVAGVPEHFNIPVHMAQEQGLYDPDLGFEWVEIKQGSGAMVGALRDGSVDVAFALTECLVAEIEKGTDLVLLGTHVASPLRWGIAVGPNSGITEVDQLEGKTFGISRYGSGSHVMASVLANQRGWKEAPKFKVCNDFATLRIETNSGGVDVFLWETFMTKPYADKGEVALIGVIPTPWSAFTAVSTREYAQANAEKLRRLLVAVRTACSLFLANEGNQSVERVSREFHLQPEDAQKWFAQVGYDTETNGATLSRASLESTRQALKAAGVISGFTRELEEYICKDVTALVE